MGRKEKGNEEGKERENERASESKFEAVTGIIPHNRNSA